MEPIFFKNWGELGRTAVLSVLGYLSLIVFLRISGKRTLAKMNVFDFVFVVALGSALSNIILNSSITLLAGLVGIGCLIVIQVILSWLNTRSHLIDTIINGEPALLVYRGKFLHDHMNRERVTEEELRAAVRADGVGPFEAVHAVVLETDGTFSVVWQKTDQSDSSLADLPPDERASAEAIVRGAGDPKTKTA